MEKKKILKRLKGGLIVSCQALEGEPLFGAHMMAQMALAAMRGGAAGIRANTASDIKEIKKLTSLPVIGLCKKVYPDSPVYITPTFEEIREIVLADADILALDGTDRPRPGKVRLYDIVKQTREQFPKLLLMADCATLADGLRAARMGFDFVGTTLCGYTEETKGTPLPNFTLIRQLSDQCELPVIAEGGIWTPEQLKKTMEYGAFAAVIGTAITRPMEITKHFISGLTG